MGVGAWVSGSSLLKGSWDLVTGAINEVTILILTYNLNSGTYNLITYQVP